MVTDNNQLNKPDNPISTAPYKQITSVNTNTDNKYEHQGQMMDNNNGLNNKNIKEKQYKLILLLFRNKFIIKIEIFFKTVIYNHENLLFYKVNKTCSYETIF